jgi:hypothetical protein
MVCVLGKSDPKKYCQYKKNRIYIKENIPGARDADASRAPFVLVWAVRVWQWWSVLVLSRWVSWYAKLIE